MRVTPDVQLLTQQLEQLRRTNQAQEAARAFEQALTGRVKKVSADTARTGPDTQTPQREAPTRSVAVTANGAPPRPGSFVDIRV